MELLDSILLGIVQGLTEFLPVSSSGHLVMAQTLLGTSPGGGIVFEVAVHVATLVAIVIFYFNPSSKKNLPFLFRLIVNNLKIF